MDRHDWIGSVIRIGSVLHIFFPTPGRATDRSRCNFLRVTIWSQIKFKRADFWTYWSQMAPKTFKLKKYFRKNFNHESLNKKIIHPRSSGFSLTNCHILAELSPGKLTLKIGGTSSTLSIYFYAFFVSFHVCFSFKYIFLFLKIKKIVWF